MHCSIFQELRGNKLFQCSLELKGICITVKLHEDISIGAVARKLTELFKSLS